MYLVAPNPRRFPLLVRISKSSGHGISNQTPIGSSEFDKSCFSIGMKNLHASKVDSTKLKDNMMSRSPDSLHHGIVAVKVKETIRSCTYGWYDYRLGSGMVAANTGLVGWLGNP